MKIHLSDTAYFNYNLCNSSRPSIQRLRVFLLDITLFDVEKSTYVVDR